MLGNTTAATGKGFAIGSAALTAMALISAYMEEIRLWFGKIAKAGEGFVTRDHIYSIMMLLRLRMMECRQLRFQLHL